MCRVLVFPFFDKLSGLCHVMFSSLQSDIEPLIKLTCSYYHASP